MENQLQSISKIFTEKIFRIPDYQRGYAWTEKQLKDYWSDIVQLEDGKNHYVGVLTLEEVPKSIVIEWKEDFWIINSKSYLPFYVVDGQQRLTTTIILIQVIIESLEKNQNINYTSKEEIQKRFIFDTKDGGVSRSYIFGYEKDNPSYEFLKAKIFNENNGTNYNIEETIYTHNLEFAKSYFKELISKLNLGQIEIIYKKITQNLLFNLYSINDDIDVFITFETMNNRGKPLSHLELLKNRLIYLSTKFPIADYERNDLRKIINDCWKAIYHYLGKNKNHPLDDDRFLLNHFIIYFEDEIKSDEESALKYKEYNRYYRNDYKSFLLESKFTARSIVDKNIKEEQRLHIKDIQKYVNSLKASVETWYYLFNPFENHDFSEEEKIWLEKLNRIGFESFAPLIMVFFLNNNDTQKRIKLLKLIEKFIFSSFLIDRPYYRADDFEYISLASNISKGKISIDKALKNIEIQIEERINHPRFIETIINNFRYNDFYFWRGIRYFLFEYDLYLQSQSKTVREKIIWEKFCKEIDDYKTIEHIYPQRPKNNSEWTSVFKAYNSIERRNLKNSLGNLLPLSKAKNSSLQNKDFIDKIGNNKDTIGFRFGCYSENEITKFKTWDAIKILKRGLKLLSFIEWRWGINLGTIEDKITILKLGAVVKKENINIAELEKEQLPLRITKTSDLISI